MEAILPFNTQDREHFCNSAIELGFDEFVAVKLIYAMQDSDLDVFQLMGGERLSLLTYSWEICDLRLQSSPTEFEFIPESLQTVIKRLTHYSLDVWFSKEWNQCAAQPKAGLLYCLRRARILFAKIPVLSLLDWDYLLQLDMRPWQIPYLSRFFEIREDDNMKPAQCIECVEEAVCAEDVTHLQREGLFLSLLRLIKMFDSGYMAAVKKLSMRIVAAWNHTHIQAMAAAAPVVVDEQHKRVLVLICHIYLMAIYELDDARGFVIDNMMHNIRFYCQNAEALSAAHSTTQMHLECTSARYIALTCAHLQIDSGEFFEAVIFDSFDESFTTLFGAVSHAYMSYVLGNMLMEMNSLNEQDFASNVENYKRILNFYVLERERSELFMLREISKQEKQTTSHNEPTTVKNITDCKSKICKGNRLSNISNYEEHIEADDNSSDGEQQDSERRIDPVFQNIPNNESVLSYVYNILAKRSYKGWQFAKLVLLLKIIGHELNVIETWRYHPGLTTDFMLNLETKLSRHFEDLAIIFQEHPFMEQEFWLTAFYLNPKPKYFMAVSRCGTRICRLRNNAQGNDENVNPAQVDKLEKNAAVLLNANFGLLSSTVDVKEIVHMGNHDTPKLDYEPIHKALHSFHLPESIVKDLLTVTFLSRNKSFAWAVNWPELRKRCKDLLKSAGRKRRLVELNMAEANDRLKFLKIDYDKYKHRPQLDYGSIEEGYENGANYQDYAINAADEEDDDEEEEDDDFTDYPSETTVPKETKSEEDLPEIFFMGTRRTRARTAAIIASVANSSKEERTKKFEEMKESMDENASVSKPADTGVTQVPSEATAATAVTDTDTTEAKTSTCKLEDWLREHISYKNNTSGFKPFADIWNCDGQEAPKVELAAFSETKCLLQKFAGDSTVVSPEHENTEPEAGIKLNVHLKNMNAPFRAADMSKTTTDMNETFGSRDGSHIDDGDDESDTSTTAFKGSHERISCSMSECDAEVNAKTEGEAECKEDIKSAPISSVPNVVTCVVASVGLTEKNVAERVTSEDHVQIAEISTSNIPTKVATESAKVASKEVISSHEPSAEHLSDEAQAKSSDSDELKKECIEKKLRVSVRRLAVSDLSKLRQPTVYLKRIRLDEFSVEQVAKRRRGPRKVYIDSDVSSKSSASSTHSEYRQTAKTNKRFTQFKRQSSDSSTEPEEFKIKRNVGRPSRGRGAYSGRARGRGQAKNLTVTPRSASGLKLRISSLSGDAADAASGSGSTQQAQPLAKLVEFIQISSESSSEAEDLTRDKYLSPVPEGFEVEEIVDPLFEEEIIVPFD